VFGITNNWRWNNVPMFAKKEEFTKDRTFLQAGANWDLGAFASWNINESFDDYGNAVTTNLSPFLEGKGYLSTYASAAVPFFKAKISFYARPTSVKFAQFDFSFAKDGSDYPTCWGASTSQTGFNAWMNFEFGWPSCKIGVIDTLINGIKNQGCKIAYHSPDPTELPFWEIDSLSFLNFNNEFWPTSCRMNDNPKFCLNQLPEEEVDGDADEEDADEKESKDLDDDSSVQLR